MSKKRGRLLNDFDLVDLNNEELDNLIAKADNNNMLEEGFEAIILTGFNTLRNDQVKLGKYRWYRIRALDGSDNGRINPFRPVAFRISNFKKLVQRHRPAFYSQNWSKSNAGKTPVAGDVWRCRYLRKRYQQPIVLEKFIRKSGLKPNTIRDDQNPGEYINGQWYLGQPQGPQQSKPFMFRGNLTYQNCVELSKGLTGLLSTLVTWINDSNPHGYDAFNCGYPIGEKSCADSVIEKFGAAGAGATFIGDPDPTLAGPVQYTIENKITEHSASVVIGSLNSWTPSNSATESGDKGTELGCAGRYLFSKLAFYGTKAKNGLLENIGRANWPPGHTNSGRQPTGPLNVPPLNTILYDKEFQDAMATFTVLQKHRLVGGYLMGKYDNPHWAAHELSKEWKNIPAQYSGKESVYYAGTTQDETIVAGKSYYYFLTQRNPPAAKAKYTTATNPGPVVDLMIRARVKFMNFLDSNPTLKDVMNQLDDLPV